MLFSNEVEELEEVLVEDEVEDTGTGEPAQLIVYNDDHNSFDWVIKCFVDVLGHASSQAEQLALIIHTKGKANVKNGPKRVLKPQKDALTERGLSAVIEEAK
ncbi:MAG: ATP-dependent Clp protease adaptor ClpS [Lewinella sp.]|jgi:ATP-dependent Clp protease adaptor protein ClpS|uniref:ATP-dependent Clp protease adaptor ClpS n=1 Tax=Lewinella TaxID=70994 RepID=UPI000364EB3D|nr:ATP-dependent Clp protease adaptor ClpS [Lewinella cohaerens]